MKRTVVLLFLTATLVLTSANACPSGTTSVPGSNLLNMINGKRAAAGCAAVSGDDNLRRAAERHAVDARDHPEIYAQPDPKKPNYRDPHKGSDGSTPDGRIRDSGFAPVTKTGEIMYVALGPPDNTEQATVDWWMGSDTHRAIIQDCGFTHAGLGLLYPGGTKWFAVMDFGAH